MLLGCRLSEPSAANFCISGGASHQQPTADAAFCRNGVEMCPKLEGVIQKSARTRGLPLALLISLNQVVFCLELMGSLQVCRDLMMHSLPQIAHSWCVSKPEPQSTKHLTTNVLTNTPVERHTNLARNSEHPMKVQ